MGTDLGPQPTRYLDPPTRESGCQIKRDRHSTMASSRLSDCPVDPNRLAVDVRVENVEGTFAVEETCLSFLVADQIRVRMTQSEPEKK